MGVPYFLSAQLDGVQREGKTSKDTNETEGWIGLIVFNIATWVTIVTLDIMLLSNEFKIKDTASHIVQTGALVSVSIAAGTIITFWVIGMCFDNPFTSSASKPAKPLPPFATSLIAGGLKATLGFTYILTLMALLMPGGTVEQRVFEMLVAQIALKHFGSAMALANQRLFLFTSDMVTSATS